MARKQFVVTGVVKRTGRRDTLSEELSNEQARKFKARLNRQLQTSVPRFKFASNLKVVKKRRR